MSRAFFSSLAQHSWVTSRIHSWVSVPEYLTIFHNKIFIWGSGVRKLPSIPYTKSVLDHMEFVFKVQTPATIFMSASLALFCQVLDDHFNEIFLLDIAHTESVSDLIVEKTRSKMCMQPHFDSGSHGSPSIRTFWRSTMTLCLERTV